MIMTMQILNLRTTDPALHVQTRDMILLCPHLYQISHKNTGYFFFGFYIVISYLINKYKY